MGWLMIHGDLDSALDVRHLQWHKSCGFVALALTAARLAAPPGRPCSAARVPLRWNGASRPSSKTALYVLAVVAIVSRAGCLFRPRRCLCRPASSTCSSSRTSPGRPVAVRRRRARPLAHPLGRSSCLVAAPRRGSPQASSREPRRRAQANVAGLAETRGLAPLNRQFLALIRICAIVFDIPEIGAGAGGAPRCCLTSMTCRSPRAGAGARSSP